MAAAGGAGAGRCPEMDPDTNPKPAVFGAGPAAGAAAVAAAAAAARFDSIKHLAAIDKSKAIADIGDAAHDVGGNIFLGGDNSYFAHVLGRTAVAYSRCANNDQMNVGDQYNTDAKAGSVIESFVILKGAREDATGNESAREEDIFKAIEFPDFQSTIVASVPLDNFDTLTANDGLLVNAIGILQDSSPFNVFLSKNGKALIGAGKEEGNKLKFIDNIVTKFDGATKPTEKTIGRHLTYTEISGNFTVHEFIPGYRHMYDVHGSLLRVRVTDTAGNLVCTITCKGGASVNALCVAAGLEATRGKKKIKNEVEVRWAEGKAPSAALVLYIKTLTDWAQIYFCAMMWHKYGVLIPIVSFDRFAVRLMRWLKTPIVISISPLGFGNIIINDPDALRINDDNKGVIRAKFQELKDLGETGRGILKLIKETAIKEIQNIPYLKTKSNLYCYYIAKEIDDIIENVNEVYERLRDAIMEYDPRNPPDYADNGWYTQYYSLITKSIFQYMVDLIRPITEITEKYKSKHARIVKALSDWKKPADRIHRGNELEDDEEEARKYVVRIVNTVYSILSKADLNSGSAAKQVGAILSRQPLSGDVGVSRDAHILAFHDNIPDEDVQREFLKYCRVHYRLDRTGEPHLGFARLLGEPAVLELENVPDTRTLVDIRNPEISRALSLSGDTLMFRVAGGGGGYVDILEEGREGVQFIDMRMQNDDMSSDQMFKVLEARFASIMQLVQVIADQRGDAAAAGGGGAAAAAPAPAPAPALPIEQQIAKAAIKLTNQSAIATANTPNTSFFDLSVNSNDIQGTYKLLNPAAMDIPKSFSGFPIAVLRATADSITGAVSWMRSAIGGVFSFRKTTTVDMSDGKVSSIALDELSREPIIQHGGAYESTYTTDYCFLFDVNAGVALDTSKNPISLMETVDNRMKTYAADRRPGGKHFISAEIQREDEARFSKYNLATVNTTDELLDCMLGPRPSAGAAAGAGAAAAPAGGAGAAAPDPLEGILEDIYEDAIDSRIDTFYTAGMDNIKKIRELYHNGQLTELQFLQQFACHLFFSDEISEVFEREFAWRADMRIICEKILTLLTAAARARRGAGAGTGAGAASAAAASGGGGGGGSGSAAAAAPVPALASPPAAAAAYGGAGGLYPPGTPTLTFAPGGTSGSDTPVYGDPKYGFATPPAVSRNPSDVVGYPGFGLAAAAARKLEQQLAGIPEGSGGAAGKSGSAMKLINPDGGPAAAAVTEQGGGARLINQHGGAREDDLLRKLADLRAKIDRGRAAADTALAKVVKQQNAEQARAYAGYATEAAAIVAGNASVIHPDVVRKAAAAAAAADAAARAASAAAMDDDDGAAAIGKVDEAYEQYLVTLAIRHAAAAAAAAAAAMREAAAAAAAEAAAAAAAAQTDADAAVQAAAEIVGARRARATADVIETAISKLKTLQTNAYIKRLVTEVITSAAITRNILARLGGAQLERAATAATAAERAVREEAAKAHPIISEIEKHAYEAFDQRLLAEAAVGGGGAGAGAGAGGGGGSGDDPKNLVLGPDGALEAQELAAAPLGFGAGGFGFGGSGGSGSATAAPSRSSSGGGGAGGGRELTPEQIAAAKKAAAAFGGGGASAGTAAAAAAPSLLPDLRGSSSAGAALSSFFPLGPAGGGGGGSAARSLVSPPPAPAGAPPLRRAASVDGTRSSTPLLLGPAGGGGGGAGGPAMPGLGLSASVGSGGGAGGSEAKKRSRADAAAAAAAAPAPAASARAARAAGAGAGAAAAAPAPAAGAAPAAAAPAAAAAAARAAGTEPTPKRKRSGSDEPNDNLGGGYRKPRRRSRKRSKHSSRRLTRRFG